VLVPLTLITTVIITVIIIIIISSSIISIIITNIRIEKGDKMVVFHLNNDPPDQGLGTTGRAGVHQS
jgi:hypothetical protein